MYSISPVHLMRGNFLYDKNPESSGNYLDRVKLYF